MPTLRVNVPDNASTAERSLIEAASAALAERFDSEMHAVACAIESNGQIEAQVNIDAYVGRMAVCADGVALTSALMQTDAPVARFVAVRGQVEADGTVDVAVVSPCGGCREAFALWAPDAEGLVLADGGALESIRGRDLLPRSHASESARRSADLLAPLSLRGPTQIDLAAAANEAKQWLEADGIDEIALAISSTGITYAGVSLPTDVERGGVCSTMVAFGRLVQAEGDGALREIVTIGSGGAARVPCGLCLEVLTDYNPDANVLLGGVLDVRAPVQDLLPFKFVR